MAVVDDETPLSNPPNTPAIHIGSLELQIITSSKVCNNQILYV